MLINARNSAEPKPPVNSGRQSALRNRSRAEPDWIIALFGATFVLIAALAFLYGEADRHSSRALDAVLREYDRIQAIASRAELAPAGLQSAQRGMALSCAMSDAGAAARYIGYYEDSLKAIDNVLAEMRPLPATETGKRAFEETLAARNAWMPPEVLKRQCASGEIRSANDLPDPNRIASRLSKAAATIVAQQKRAIAAAREKFVAQSDWIGLPGVLCGLLCGIAGCLAARRVSRDLTVLTVGADLMGAGNLDCHFPEMGKGEIGDLARSFNNMAEQLRASRAELETRQRKLESLREVAESANEAKSQFLANMSHELRTPMNAIIGYSEMIIDEAGDLGLEDSVADLLKINAAGKHLLGLINDILDLSKIEAGRMDLYLETFDVRSMIEELPATIQPMVEKNSNSLVVDVAPDVGSMHADVTKVRQTLLNLLSNACKFTQAGKIGLNVWREHTNGGAWIVFEVKDSGIGMGAEGVARLFQPFTQADSSTTRKYGGTGLGLTITRKFCEMMGGDIAVASELGAGSTFTIRLPETVVGEPGASPKSELGVKPMDTQRDAICDVKGSVLVIDDDASAQGLMHAYLVKAGYLVTIAPGGGEGLELARKLRPDLITLDIMMPRMDGWSVLSSLKSDPDLAGIPVVVISMIQDRNMAFSLGAADYLPKPVNRDHLIAVLRKHQPVSAPV
jgi:signal transduction histidine kinase/ActR/RegA family two-component response regulator